MSGIDVRFRLDGHRPSAYNVNMDTNTQAAEYGTPQEAGLDPATQTYARTVRLGACEGWMRVSCDAAKNHLLVELAPCLAPRLMPLLAQVRQQFDLDANPTIIEAHLSQDPLFRTQLGAHPGLRVPGAFDAFELAIRAILGQQISVAAAGTLAGRLVTRFGPPVCTPWPGLTHHFPDAATLAALSAAEIAQIGLPPTRAATIVCFAGFAAQGGLVMKPGSSLEQTLAQLCAVRGIGDWTAQYIALRALRFPDAFPAGDLGLQKAAAATTQPARLSASALTARARAWSPWRAYAALALWQSLAPSE
jgi:AraC family transcriptional regulator of adaptative response / DNA-3-methyladenine glycosylase II